MLIFAESTTNTLNIMDHLSKEYTKKFLVQASKYIENIKKLDQCKQHEEVMDCLKRFPYLSNNYFAMGMKLRYLSEMENTGFYIRTGEEILSKADSDLGHHMEVNDVVEDLCTCDFYYKLKDKRAWATCLFACGYYIESMILAGIGFDLSVMKRDRLFCSIFGSLYLWLKDHYATNVENGSEDNQKILDRLSVMKSDTENSIELVEMDINYVPRILKEKLDIINYLIEKLS